MRRRLAIPALVLCVLGLATACGGSSDSAGPDQPGATRSSEPTGPGSGSPTGDPDSGDQAKVIDVTIEGDQVTPNGDRVEVAVGQPIDLMVTADAPGEIHVHSTPEQELSYTAGTSRVRIAPIEQPGTVDVESHALDKVIVQLEVH